MGFPLPTQTLLEINQKYWQDGDDLSEVTPQEAMERQDRALHGSFKRWLRRTDQQEPDLNVTDNLCEPIVATGVDFLLGDEVRFEVMNDSHSAATGAPNDADSNASDAAEDPSEQVDEEAQEYLDAVWDANVKMPTLAEEEINKATFGHGFIKLDPQDPDMPTAPGGQRIPALLVLNPMQMQVQTQPANIRKVARYAQYYTDTDEKGNTVYCRQLTVRQSDGSWEVRDQEKRSAGTAATVASVFDAARAEQEAEQGWTDTKVTAWPYTWSPVHDGKNLPEPNSYWGKSDLRLDIIHLNDEINLIQSAINRILYIHAHPKMVFFGTHTREIDASPTGSMQIPNPNARVEMLQITADGLEQARAFVEDLRQSIDGLSHVPSVAVGRLRNLPGIPSGVALKVAYRPLVSQTLQKRNLREALYTKLCQHILELGGFGSDRKIVVHWPEMLPSDELAEAQSALIWKQIGASTDTLLQRGDFDPDVEAAKKAEEAEDAQEQMIAKQQAMQDAGLAPMPQPIAAAPGQPSGQAVDSTQPNQSQASQAPPPSQSQQQSQREKRPSRASTGASGASGRKKRVRTRATAK